MTRKFYRLPDEYVQKILDLARNGARSIEIAIALDISEQTVYRCLRKSSVITDRGDGLVLRNKVVSAQQLYEAANLIQQGSKISDVAKFLGISSKAVAGRIQRGSLPPQKNRSQMDGE